MIDDVIGTSSSPTTLNSISKLLNPKFISPAQPPPRTHISNYLMSPRCLKGISNPIWLGELLIVLPTASHFTTIHPVPWPQTYESSLSFPPPHTSYLSPSSSYSTSEQIDQHFTLRLNMHRTHILRLETKRMQTSVIRVVGSRHLWAVRKREKEIPPPILPVNQAQEEIKVKNNDKKITQPMIPSLVLAFQVKFNKETNSHCWQPPALGQRTSHLALGSRLMLMCIPENREWTNRIIPRNLSYAPIHERILRGKGLQEWKWQCCKITVSTSYSLWFRPSPKWGTYLIESLLRQGQKLRLWYLFVPDMTSENKTKKRQKKLQWNPALTTTQPSTLTSNSTFSVKLFPNGFFTCPFPP